MQHKTGDDRNQMFMFSLDSSIAAHSVVRVLDAFVESIDLKSFGFSHVECKDEGRPPYPPSVLLKLYLYGYYYGIRTSRKLAREAQTNMEAMWLLNRLCPKYRTIASFREKHSKAFREVFRRFVYLTKEWGLIEGQTIAIDSFKIRGSNSLKNNFNEKKLKRHLEYIDNQIQQYQDELDRNDKEEDRKELEEKLAERLEKKDKYEKIKVDLETSGQEQISTTDPDSRSVVLHRNIINVGYNVQASCDAKYKLLVEYGTGDVNDTHALSPMALQTKELLQVDAMKVIADKGYHTGGELAICMENNIETYVSPKAPATKDVGLYPVGSFIYNKENGHYTCPQGHKMQTNGTWHKHHDKRRNKKSAYRFQRYTTPACKQCASRPLCTKSTTNGRYIDRSEYAEAIEANNQRVQENKDYYRKRQQITEHQFGTLKRQRGFTHALVRKKENVLGEVGLMFIGYNLRRCITILGADVLIKLLRDNSLRDFSLQIQLILSHFGLEKKNTIKIAC